MLRVATLFLCTLCACSSASTTGVELTLRFDDSVSDDTLATITALSIVSSGDEEGTYSFTLGRKAHREERLVYRPLPTSHEIGLAITASDASGVVAIGSQASIALDPTRATAIEITLVGGDVDGGVDLYTAQDGSPSGCPSTTEALCEDFESTLGSAWTPHMTNGTAVIDTAHAHGGTHAMHFHGNAIVAGADADVRISETQTMSPLPSDVFVRAYYLFATTLSTDTQLSALGEAPSPYEGVTLLFDGQELTVGDTVGTPTTRGTSVSISTYTWHCIEWQVHPAMNTTGSTHVWLDGTALPSLTTTEVTNPSAGLSVLSVGAGTYAPPSAVAAYDVWVDDVVVDVARIGCQ